MPRLSRSLEPTHKDQSATYDLLLVFHSNYGSILDHLDYNSSTGYLSSTELHLSNVYSCI